MQSNSTSPAAADLSSSRPIRCVGVVGLGRMGEAFARNLIADGNSVSSWFSAEEIQDSRNQTSRPDVAKKISTLVAGLKEEVAG